MAISVPPSQFASPSLPTGLAPAQLDALAKLVVQMRAIQRDPQLPEQEKKKQIEMLRTQTDAIRQGAEEKAQARTSADMVAATEAAAGTVRTSDAPARQAARPSDPEPGDTARASDGGGEGVLPPAASTGPTTDGAEPEKSLGTVVDTYA